VFTSSRPVGGTLVLDALWRRLGIDTVMSRLLTGRKRDPRTERVLSALVANRAGLQAVAAGRTRLAGHEDHPGAAAGLPPARSCIRAHVILCWLALLLVRIIETTTGGTWNRVRIDLQELHVGTFEGPAGRFRQRTELSTAQRDILNKLAVDAPKKIIELGPPPATS
jgi:hypothetical protein